MAKENTFGPREVLVEDLMSLTEAATYLGLAPMTVWGWVEAKLLPSAKIGTATVVHVADVSEVNDMMRTRQASIAGRSKKSPQSVNA